MPSATPHVSQAITHTYSPYYSGAHRPLPQAIQAEDRRGDRRRQARRREAARLDLCEARGPSGDRAAHAARRPALDGLSQEKCHNHRQIVIELGARGAAAGRAGRDVYACV